MKLNKEENFKLITLLSKGKMHDCIKLPIDNIIFPEWGSITLLSKLLRQTVITKENPLGETYDETKFTICLRLINGRLLDYSGMADIYTWKTAKVKDIVEHTKQEDLKFIGTNTLGAIKTLHEVLNTMEDPSEKDMLISWFLNFKKDFLFIHTESEERVCVMVTKELLDKVQYCVNEWETPDQDGLCEAMRLTEGDYLIVNMSSQTLYRIEKETFEGTHKLLN